MRVAGELELLQRSIETELRESVRVFDRELESSHPFVAELCRRIARYRGKMLRPTLLLLTGRACGRLTPEHVTLAAVVEMVHVATLVHDDVLDDADLRRGGETINRFTHNEAAVLLGDYLISHAYHLCSSIGSQAVARRIAAATNRVCEGELMQVHHRGDWDLTEERYFEIIRGKTAELTRAACELGAVLAGADAATVERMAEYGERIGTAFQIVDDLLDVTAGDQQTGKSTGRDAELGKSTLPMIHFLATAEPSERDAALKLAGDRGPQARQRLSAMLESAGSLAFARRAAQAQIEAAVSRLDSLPRSEAAEALRIAAEFTLRRRA